MKVRKKNDLSTSAATSILIDEAESVMSTEFELKDLKILLKKIIKHLNHIKSSDGLISNELRLEFILMKRRLMNQISSCNN